MVSLKQIEKKKKFQAKKKKEKRNKHKSCSKDPKIENSPSVSPSADNIEMIQPELEAYLTENHIEGEFREIFLKFEPKSISAAPPSLEEASAPDAIASAPVALSNKKLKKLNRPSVFELKQKIKRPEVVEWVDITAKDPYFLVYLKSYKNAVPVPKHWSQKKKFLQIKRGSEKMPFMLPDFIEATGITKIRAQMRERDAGKLLKQRMRERMNPKLGRLDIDYQVLHDAFFKNQKKPKMAIHGDVYHEGKENELKMRVYRPGQLSDELKLALGMPEGCPPPWLINMQRFGTPPAYPHLRIPGLNAPMPEGAMGYGSWGENDKTLYSDPSNSMKNRFAAMDSEYNRTHWGDILPDPEEEEADLLEEEEMEDDTINFIRNAAYTGFTDLTPLINQTVNMIQGTQTVIGYETPLPVDLRKK